MGLVQVLGLVAAAVCLLAYLLRPGRVFDWCNALLWVVVALASLEAQAWGALLLNVGFGLAGAWHLWRAAHPKYGSHEHHLALQMQLQKSILAEKLMDAGGPLSVKDDL
jgi:hypothetical protein